jgi:hypothetical protein
MSFHTKPRTTPGAKSIELPATPLSVSSETRGAKRVAHEVCDSWAQISDSLDRALVTLGRDSALRRKHLRNRWQRPHTRVQVLSLEQRQSWLRLEQRERAPRE